jgi:hypothetical protein
VTDRQERIARNEALFREVNERIRELPPDGDDQELTEFLCECGNADCTAPIQLSLAEYEQVRADPTQFAVIRDHVAPDVEELVAENERFVTVRKHPHAATVARESDPRNNR